MEEVRIDNLLKEKRALKEELAGTLDFNCKKALLGVFIDSELSDREARRLKGLLKGLRELNLEVVVLADSNLKELGLEQAGERVKRGQSATRVLKYSRKNREKLLYAADMGLVLDCSDVGEMLFNGVIPVAGKRSGVEDYNPLRETGNGFVYDRSSKWAIFAAVVRAVETYKFKYDWRHIVRQGVTGA